MDPRRAVHAMAFGALVAAATVGIILGALLLRPREVVSVAQNRTPTAGPTVISTETPRPTQTATGTATGTATPNAAATSRAMVTATPTKAPPTATPAPTNTPVPTSTPTSAPTTTPSPEPTRSPITSPTTPGQGQQARLTPEQTVARYYEHLDRRQFEANYAMLSASGRQQEGSLSDWERALSPIVGASIRDISTQNQSTEEATVTGTVELTRNVDGQITRSRYQANVFLVAEDGAWKIDRILRSNETTVP